MVWIIFRPASDSVSQSVTAEQTGDLARYLGERSLVVLPESTENPSPVPTAVPSVTPLPDVDYLADIQATATALLDDRARGSVQNDNGSVPLVVSTPHDGRWVVGYYPVGYCPTGHESRCEDYINGAPQVMVPMDYGCDAYGCGFGHND